jgi:hypothetical protein
MKYLHDKIQVGLNYHAFEILSVHTYNVLYDLNNILWLMLASRSFSRTVYMQSAEIRLNAIALQGPGGWQAGK